MLNNLVYHLTLLIIFSFIFLMLYIWCCVYASTPLSLICKKKNKNISFKEMDKVH
jgi:hypothetical protein